MKQITKYKNVNKTNHKIEKLERENKTNNKI